MKQTMAIGAAGLAAFAFAASLEAHHTGSMYDVAPVWVKGAVVRFESINPHTITILEEQTADGQVRRWAVEGPGRSQLERMNIARDVPRLGDVMEFCAFPYKSAEELSRMFPGVDFSARRSFADTDSAPPQAVAGHVMVTPNGDMRLWEPHGLIGECVRSSEYSRLSWLDFLNSRPDARQAWCVQRGHAHIRSSGSLRELVENIDGLIDDPCE